MSNPLEDMRHHELSLYQLQAWAEDSRLNHDGWTHPYRLERPDLALLCRESRN